MNPKVQRLCLWCGPALMAVFFTGMIAAHWFPPPLPSATAEQTARMYQQHTNGIRMCAILVALGGGLFAPFVAAISSQLRRIEGPYSTLSYLQLGMGVLGTAFFTLPTVFWMAAAFDPYRNPEITQALHAAGWLPLVALIFPAMFQNAAIALAIFTDTRPEPVFPRWVGYFNIWVALLFVPSVLVMFFKSGPFGWNGVMTFWLAANVFTIWLIVMLVVARRAVAQQEAEEAADRRAAVDSEASAQAAELTGKASTT